MYFPLNTFKAEWNTHSGSLPREAIILLELFTTVNDMVQLQINAVITFSVMISITTKDHILKQSLLVIQLTPQFKRGDSTIFQN